MKKLISKFLFITTIIFCNFTSNSFAKDSDLTFFTIPGAISYAVDFKNQTIYLPNSQSKSLKIEELSEENMFAINVNKDHFNKKIIETIVTTEVGDSVDFGKLESYKIDKGNKIKI